MDSPRFAAYERKHRLILEKPLGFGQGQDGIVYRTSIATAAKFFDHAPRFHRELQVYQAVTTRNIVQVAGHAVPQMIRHDDELMAIEMTIVRPPFVLDFAGAKLPHEVPDFEQEVLDEHYEHLRELFGQRWTDALHVAEMFRQATGFALLDIHPGNIAFADP